MRVLFRIGLIVGAFALLNACTTTHDHDGCCLQAPTSY